MWPYVLLGVVCLLLAVFAWGALHLRQSRKVARDAIMMVKTGDVEPLRMECESVFLQRFGERLSLHDFDASARLLSDHLDHHETLKRVFARDDFYWYFILPVGAYLGELLRVHAGAKWEEAEDGGLEMSIPVGDGVATTFPFDKVMKQVTLGARGDIYTYLTSAADIERLITKAPQRGELDDPEVAPGGR